MNVNSNLNELNETNLSIPDSWLDGMPENYRLMEVKGDLYTPYYQDGDLVLISLEIWKDNPSDIYLVEMDGKTELRKIIKTDNQTVVLEGISPFVPPHVCPHGSYDIIGFPYMLIRKINGG